MFWGCCFPEEVLDPWDEGLAEAVPVAEGLLVPFPRGILLPVAEGLLERTLPKLSNLSILPSKILGNTFSYGAFGCATVVSFVFAGDFTTRL